MVIDMKWLIGLCVFLMAPLTHAFDLNLASAFELESMRGIGQTMARNIVAERETHGAFKSWDDFQSRVKGIAEKKLKKMQDSGLTLNVNTENKNTQK